MMMADEVCKRFAVSVSACRDIPSGISYVVRSAVIWASSSAEANVFGVSYSLEWWPSNDGWKDHDACSVQIDEDC